jgi:hypothetical protein
MLVISSGSSIPTAVRLYSLTYVGDVPALPMPAPAPALHPQARTYAIASASAAIDHAPHYSIVDTHGDGCSAYYAPRYSLVPALDEWQSEVISAVQRMRRWRYYSDSPD